MTLCSFGCVSGQALGSQASALLTAGSGFSSQSSVAPLLSCPGKPAFVVPSCSLTQIPPWRPRHRRVSSTQFISDSLFPSISAPTLLQPFVVGPGFPRFLPSWFVRSPRQSLHSCPNCLTAVSSSPPLQRRPKNGSRISFLGRRRLLSLPLS